MTRTPGRAAAKVTLRLYGREACHLCERMAAELAPYRERLGLELEWVDVDTDPALARRFGADVPVLWAGDQELCRHFLDHDALLRHFGQPVE